MAILLLEKPIEPLAFQLNAAAVATLADLPNDQTQNLKLLGYGSSRPWWVGTANGEASVCYSAALVNNVSCAN